MSAAQVVLVMVVVMLTASALGVVHARQESRQLFSQLERLQRERDEINIEWGQLQLEMSTWAETNRIENLARNELGMRFPVAQDIIVVMP